MSKFTQTIRNILARTKGSNSPKNKLQNQVSCKFCGQTGHTDADCPNAAKFHVFSVDHDAEDAGDDKDQ